jgi:hypothetical protein
MENSPNNQDKTLSQFDKWLKENKIQPSSDMLERIRGQLQDRPVDLEHLLDECFHPDTQLRDPDMIRKIRARLRGSERERTGTDTWLRWVAPLAAAATLTLAFVSFQSRSGEAPSTARALPASTAAEAPSVQLDSDVTQIFALAVNLHVDSDMTKLESVENLAFLFD